MEKKKYFFEGIFLFTIGCLFGYLFETILCFFQFGKYESRKGLIYGPFNVIYGLAFVLAPILLKKYAKKPVQLVLLSFCYGGIYEYLCSWIQETFFGTISWDYESHWMNFDGRTSLFMMCVWALIGFVMIRIFYPFLLKMIKKVPEKLLLPLSIFFTVFFVLDILLSSFAMIREQMRLEDREAITPFGRFLDQNYPTSLLDEVYPHRMDPKTKKELRFNPKLHPKSS